MRFIVYYRAMDFKELLYYNIKSDLPVIDYFDRRYDDVEIQIIESSCLKDPFALLELGYRHLYGKNGAVKDLERAYAYFQKVLLYQKNTLAMFYLGLVCMQDTNKYNECIPYLEAAYKLGYATAAYLLGTLYMNYPDIIPCDYEKAYSYLMFAKEHGVENTDGKLGNAAFYLKQYDLAKRYYEIALDNGNKQYASDLGKMYYEGYGVSKDLKKAKYYFEIGYQSGGKVGFPALMLGSILMSGTNEEQYRAYELLKQASSNNYSEANYGLGKLLLKGIPGKLDSNPSAALQYFLHSKSNLMGKAYYYAAICCQELDNANDSVKYLLKASQLGYHVDDDYIISNNSILLQYSIMSGNPIVSEYNDKYDKASIEDVRSASDKDPAAMYELASRYRLGEQGVSKDNEKALYYYKKTLLHERHAGAYNWISNILVYDLKLKDIGLDYLRTAYSLGHTGAAISIGIEYEFGESKGFTKDYDKAIQCYTFARDHGNTYADCRLGNLYLKMGRENLAEKHYRIAVDNNIDEAMCRLGKLLFTRNERDEGLKLIKKSAEMGFDEAKEFLSELK